MSWDSLLKYCQKFNYHTTKFDKDLINTYLGKIFPHEVEDDEKNFWYKYSQLILYTRDIQSGLGKKFLFEELFLILCEKKIEIAEKMIELLSIYGSWKDLKRIANIVRMSLAREKSTKLISIIVNFYLHYLKSEKLYEYQYKEIYHNFLNHIPTFNQKKYRWLAFRIAKKYHKWLKTKTDNFATFRSLKIHKTAAKTYHDNIIKLRERKSFKEKESKYKFTETNNLRRLFSQLSSGSERVTEAAKQQIDMKLLMADAYSSDKNFIPIIPIEDLKHKNKTARLSIKMAGYLISNLSKDNKMIILYDGKNKILMNYETLFTQTKGLTAQVLDKLDSKNQYVYLTTDQNTKSVKDLNNPEIWILNYVDKQSEGIKYIKSDQWFLHQLEMLKLGKYKNINSIASKVIFSNPRYDLADQATE